MRKSIDIIVEGLKIKDWPCTFEEYENTMKVNLENRIYLQPDIILEYLGCIKERTLTEDRKQLLSEIADNVYSRITPRELPRSKRKTVHYSKLNVDYEVYELKPYNFKQNEVGIEIAARIYHMIDPKKGEAQFGSIVSDLAYSNQMRAAEKVVRKLESLGYESLQIDEGEFANRIRRMEKSGKKYALFEGEGK